MIEGSVGSKLFQNIYSLNEDGEEINITESGVLSCAYFVSSILLIHNLLKSAHATVDGTIKDMLESGWYEVSELKTGTVILWENDIEGAGLHRHLGFYIGDDRAISNSSEERFPKIHDINFGDKQRKIEKIYWHDNLNN